MGATVMPGVLPRVKEEVVPEVQQNYSAMGGNALLTGLAVTYVFGNRLAYGMLMGSGMGIACMVAHAALACLNKQDTQHFWFTFDSKIVQHLKDYWKSSPSCFKWQVVIAVVLRALGVAVQQNALVWLKYSLMASPAQAIFTIFQICILGPAAEEVIFRGFVMEKLRDVQVLIFGEGANGYVHLKMRNFLQAVGFGALHYSPAQGPLNTYICISTYFVGKWIGAVRIQEEYRVVLAKMYNKCLIDKKHLEECLKFFPQDVATKAKLKELNSILKKAEQVLGIKH